MNSSEVLHNTAESLQHSHHKFLELTGKVAALPETSSTLKLPVASVIRKGWVEIRDRWAFVYANDQQNTYLYNQLERRLIVGKRIGELRVQADFVSDIFTTRKTIQSQGSLSYDYKHPGLTSCTFDLEAARLLVHDVQFGILNEDNPMKQFLHCSIDSDM